MRPNSVFGVAIHEIRLPLVHQISYRDVIHAGRPAVAGRSGRGYTRR
jgi:hypothetical protein